MAKSKLTENPIFLKSGKYFLIGLFIGSQILLAYQIIDKNYETLYAFIGELLPEQSATYQLEELVVNPSGSNGQRYLVVEIGLDLKDRRHIELIQNQQQRIKHEMNEALSSRTVDQLTQFEVREQLREELAVIINEAIGTGSVRNLYYTRYVMQ